MFTVTSTTSNYYTWTTNGVIKPNPRFDVPKLKYAKSKLSSLAKQVPFKYTMGIELTFVPEVYDAEMEKDNEHPRWGEAAEAYRLIAEAYELGNTQMIHADPGCVEYPSPILSTWKEAREWYDIACAIGKSLGYVPYQEDQEGGMGHIHIGMRKLQAACLHADLIARPYLTWIMATPNGSEYCKSLARAYMQKPPLRLIDPFSGFNELGTRVSPDSCVYDIKQTFIGIDHKGEVWHDVLDDLAGREDYQLADDRFSLAPYNSLYKTVEWRAFDAAEDWETQESHLAFLQRYCLVILSKSTDYGAMPWGNGVSPTVRKATLRAIIDAYRKDKDRCAREFKELIVNTLELPWERYEPMLERNLDAAFAWGKRW